MEEMNAQDICNFVQAAITTLMEQKKAEVMKCVGEFVYNDKIKEINEQIISLQKQCKHLAVGAGGKCNYCGKQIIKLREV